MLWEVTHTLGVSATVPALPANSLLVLHVQALKLSPTHSLLPFSVYGNISPSLFLSISYSWTVHP